MDRQELIEYYQLLSEAERRQTSKYSQYEPLPKQLEFHKSLAWVRILTGGNRSGKSRSAAQEINWYGSASHPYQKTPEAPRIWVIAPEYRVIYEGIWLHLVNTIPDWNVAKFGPRIPTWDIRTYIEYKGGGRVDFISAEGGEADRKKLQAAEIDLACIDEEIQEDLWKELMMRLLTRGGRAMITATLVNSEEWILNLIEKSKEKPKKYFAVQLDTRKNPYNDPEILSTIIEDMSVEEQEVRIKGNPRIMKGIIYGNWSEANEIEPFIIPPNWPRIHIFDPGARVAAALWIALSPKGYHIAYREMYLRFVELRDCVEFWKVAEGERFDGTKWSPTPECENITWRVIDPAAFRQHEDGSLGSGDQLAIDYGYTFMPAINNKSQNIEDVRRLLMPPNDPKLKIVNTLDNFKMERRNYRIKEDRSKRNTDAPKARPVKGKDHLMNCIEYYASFHFMYDHPETQETQEAREAMLDEADWNLPENLDERRNKIIRLKRIRQKRKKRMMW